MSTTIQTVLGAVPLASLGITMMHEHLALALSETQTVDDEHALASELDDLKQLGCQTIVELSNIGMGRDAQRLVKLAQISGLNIITATGFYTQRWHPTWLADCSTDDLAKLMITEIQQGIEGGSVRAGIIGEIGTSRDAITPDEERVMRAAARAHRSTGRPISTHTSLGNLPLQQLDILADEGVDLRYVTIGHLDLADDFDEVVQVAERGAFVEFDTFGKEAYQKDSVRVGRLLDLVERGFGGSLLVSCDISRNEYMKPLGGYGYDHFLRVNVPQLRQCGISEGALNAILVDNPRRFLEGAERGY